MITAPSPAHCGSQRGVPCDGLLGQPRPSLSLGLVPTTPRLCSQPIAVFRVASYPPTETGSKPELSRRKTVPASPNQSAPTRTETTDPRLVLFEPSRDLSDGALLQSLAPRVIPRIQAINASDSTKFAEAFPWVRAHPYNNPLKLQSPTAGRNNFLTRPSPDGPRSDIF